MKDYTKDYPPEALEPFFPNEFLRHVLVTLFLVIIVFLGVVFLPETTQDRVDDGGTYEPKPLWFLLPIHGLFELIPSNTLCFTLLGIGAAALISLPFWDRAKERRLWRKQGLFGAVIAWVIIFVILGVLGRLL